MRSRGAPARLDARLVHVGVPDVEVAHGRELTHGGAIGAYARAGHRLSTPRAEPTAPSGHGEAGGEPGDVPLERAGRRFVEVIHVENQVTLRRSEDPEVREVRVTAELHLQLGARQRAEV